MEITDEILVKFQPNVSDEQQKFILHRYGLTLLKTTEIYQRFKIPKGSNALRIANELFETGLFLISYPSFLSKFELLQIYPNDLYFNKQIALHNTGQSFLPDNHSGTIDADIDAPEAWTISTGCNNIIVAVLDEGISSNHPDLPNSRQVRLSGSNFADGNSNDPSPTGNLNHGNACAGIIAASMNNSQGISGIAPNCKVMPIRVVYSDGDLIAEEDLALAIRFAVDNGANIISNSWGIFTTEQNYSQLIDSAMHYAIDNGCILIFAAGNDSDHNIYFERYARYPANSNISGVITVGASDRNDHQANYSPTDFAIDVVAPSSRSMPGYSLTGETYEMWTIDIVDSAGYNPYPESMDHPPATNELIPNSGTNHLAYTSRFGGTSFSCPVVAGIAALMLSIDSDLNSSEVLNILRNTADKVGGYTYENGRCNQMGYGRVNAYNALLAVASGPITGDNLVCRSTNKTYIYNNPPSGKTIYWTCSDNLETVSGQYTNSFIVKAASSQASGEGWIRASISDCHNSGIVCNVWVGTPSVTISGPTNGSIGNSYTYYEYPVSYSNPTSFEWTLSPPVDGNNIYSYGTWANAAFYGGGGYLQIGCTPTNTCGTGTMITTYIDIYDPDYFLLSPNPASDYVTITVKKSLVNISKTNEIGLDNEDVTYSVIIIDLYGSIFHTSTESGNSFTIPLNNLKNGTYILKITNNKTASSLRLIVNH
jgi:subtilisin family serine protease